MLPSIFRDNLFDDMFDFDFDREFDRMMRPLYGKHAQNMMKTDVRESTDEIFERVWNEKVYEVNNTVMVHIRRLREKIEDNSRSPKILKTVWGVGYKIEG